MENDLISRSALLGVPNVRKVCEYDETGCSITYKAVPVEVIEKAPSVDAVEVVRCKDCEHFKKYADHSPFIGTCELAKYYVGERGYCVFGIRREPDGK